MFKNGLLKKKILFLIKLHFNFQKFQINFNQSETSCIFEKEGNKFLLKGDRRHFACFREKEGRLLQKIKKKRWIVKEQFYVLSFSKIKQIVTICLYNQHHKHDYTWEATSTCKVLKIVEEKFLVQALCAQAYTKHTISF